MFRQWKMLIEASGYRLDLECELPADLREYDLFCELTDREEKALRGAFIGRRYEAGHFVFQEGEPGLGMYVVAKGEVEILRNDSGRRLAVLGPGEVFGEIALLNEVTRMAAARAATASELLLLFQPAFLDVIDKRPRLGVKVLLALARVIGIRHIQTDHALDELVQHRDHASPGRMDGSTQLPAGHRTTSS
jgi:CRP/FNR family cyclic AMP-dependent transcriptional regulator